MTTEQFKILCRAYWPDCHFADTSFGDILCYPDLWVRVCLNDGFVNGWLGEDAEYFINGRPETVVKKVAEDMDRRYNENLGV